jgi:hypothetical protein
MSANDLLSSVKACMENEDLALVAFGCDCILTDYDPCGNLGANVVLTVYCKKTAL